MSIQSKKEVLVFSNIIAPYNIPLFNHISRLLNNSVLFLFDQAKEANRSWKVPAHQIQFDYTVENTLHFTRSSKSANGASLHQTIYFPFFIIKKIWLHKPAVVLTIEFGLRTIFSLLMCKLIGARLYVISDVTPVTESKAGFLKQTIRKLIIRNIDGAVARSYTAQRYLESLGMLKKKIVVSPYVIEYNSHLQPANADDKGWMLTEELKEKIGGKFCFLYSGHISRSKGIDLLLNVVNKLPGTAKEKMVFLFVGGSEKDLQQISPDFNKELFLPLGFVPYEQMPLVYPIADCLVLPTRSDTWAMVVNEAVVAGCAVMVSKYAGSAGELIVDGNSGVVFDPLDENEFADRLLFCLENRQQLFSYAEAAKEKLSVYSNRKSASRIVDFIKAASMN